MKTIITGSGYNPENGHVVDPTLEATVTERPALFNTEMVRAILAGKKRHTRRLVTPQPPQVEAVRFLSGSGYGWIPPSADGQPWLVAGPVSVVRDLMGREPELKCPFGRPGDRLWVRETWGCPVADHPLCKDGRKPTEGDALVYLANPADEYQWGRDRGSQGGFVWRPSIHMPRWACRLELTVTGVRIERLQGITTDDIIAEGIEVPDVDYSVAERPDFLDAERDSFARAEFRTLWDGINSKRPGCPWKDSPLVWVVEFEVAP